VITIWKYGGNQALASNGQTPDKTQNQNMKEEKEEIEIKK
jgi:hypothetical protein